METISGFLDASVFRIYNNIPCYYIEGDSYLAKFKTGLKLEDVIDFNDACDLITERQRPFEKMEVNELLVANQPSYNENMHEDSFVYRFSGKKINKKVGGKSRIPKKVIQKYMNKKRDAKQFIIETEIIETYCCLVDVDSELKTYRELWELKAYYKKNILNQIVDKHAMIEWKRKMRAWSSLRPTDCFEKNGILYYYYYTNEILYIHDAFIKIAPLDNISCRTPINTISNLIQEGNYNHFTNEKFKKDILELFTDIDYDRYEFDNEPEDRYDDYNGDMLDRFYNEEDMLEYYADF